MCVLNATLICSETYTYYYMLSSRMAETDNKEEAEVLLELLAQI